MKDSPRGGSADEDSFEKRLQLEKTADEALVGKRSNLSI